MPNTIPNTPGRKEIADIYATALNRLRATVYGIGSEASKRQAAGKIIEIQSHIKWLKSKQNSWAAHYIPQAYRIGAKQDDELLRRLLGSEYSGTFTQLHRSAAQVAAETAALDFGAVADALEKTYTGYISRIQIEGARRAIATEIGGGIIEGASRQTVAKRLVDVLRENTNDGMITVGKVTMRADSYADLLARTVSRAARTEGTINRLKENDIDLVIVSNTGAVDFCREYEDQIFSLSGNDSRFPVLTDRPPFHPNCTHTLEPFVEEFADEGEIVQGQKFKRSNIGKSAREMAKKYPEKRPDKRTRTKGK